MKKIPFICNFIGEWTTEISENYFIGKCVKLEISDYVKAHGPKFNNEKINYFLDSDIFIGRMLKSKQPQLLINIYEYLINEIGNSICIHFVGDGDYLNQLKEIVKCKGIENNIKFYGAIHDDIKSGELLYCSDLMIMPGYVGLSVNHAFNFDCPVVTWQQKENGPFHSPEIEYLINEKTGFIIESHSVEATSEMAAKYLDNKDIQFQMRLNIRKMIETTCSINNFIKGFDDTIKFVVKEKSI